MKTQPAVLPNFSGLRKARKISQENLVRTEKLFAETDLPLAVFPTVDDLDSISWAASNRQWIQSLL
jgi:hypothetical protein